MLRRSMLIRSLAVLAAIPGLAALRKPIPGASGAGTTATLGSYTRFGMVVLGARRDETWYASIEPEPTWIPADNLKALLADRYRYFWQSEFGPGKAEIRRG